MMDRFQYSLRAERDRNSISVLIVLVLACIMAVSAAFMAIERNGYDHEQLTYWSQQ